MVLNEESHRRIQAIEDDVKSLQEALYGDKNYVGLNTRIKVLEERLQIFWWAVAVFGSTVIGLVVRTVFKVFGGASV